VYSVAGIGRWARHPIGWRSRLSVAGAALGVLPLVQGEWLAAPVAGIGGLVVVGGWAVGTSGGRTVGMAVGTGLLASLTAVFAVSQWPRGLISPPPDDWLAGWLLIGVGCLVGLVVDWSVHASDGVVRLGATGVVLSTRQAVHAAAGLITTSMAVICCGGLFAPFFLNSDGALRFAARDGEILPLPPTLHLISADNCADGGSSGNCTAEFVVTARDGAARAITVDRLVDHLRRLGWPLLLHQSAYHGCRETGGILPWTPHCLWLYADAEPMPARSPTRPEAVTVYIDNLG
jgi:hypothetical protein